MSLRILHEVGALETRDVHLASGQPRRDAWLLPGGVLVQVISALRWFWYAATGGFRGVLIRDRGEKRAPMVMLDWETYSRMVVGLKPEALRSILPALDGTSEHEDGGSY
jgi:hypothetical protein